MGFPPGTTWSPSQGASFMLVSGAAGTSNPVINCDTVLPDGRTLGSVIREQRAVMATTYSTLLDSNIGRRFSTFISIVGPNGPIDFKKGQSGQTFVEMGLAGNFAYYAIGAGFFSPSALDAGAGAYALTAAAFFPHSTVHFSDLTGNFFSDSAANQMRGPGLAANGCSIP